MSAALVNRMPFRPRRGTIENITYILDNRWGGQHHAANDGEEDSRDNFRLPRQFPLDADWVPKVAAIRRQKPLSANLESILSTAQDDVVSLLLSDLASLKRAGIEGAVLSAKTPATGAFVRSPRQHQEGAKPANSTYTFNGIYPALSFLPPAKSWIRPYSPMAQQTYSAYSTMLSQSYQSKIPVRVRDVFDKYRIKARVKRGKQFRGTNYIRHRTSSVNDYSFIRSTQSPISLFPNSAVYLPQPKTSSLQQTINRSQPEIVLRSYADQPMRVFTLSIISDQPYRLNSREMRTRSTNPLQSNLYTVQSSLIPSSSPSSSEREIRVRVHNHPTDINPHNFYYNHTSVQKLSSAFEYSLPSLRVTNPTRPLHTEHSLNPPFIEPSHLVRETMRSGLGYLKSAYSQFSSSNLFENLSVSRHSIDKKISNGELKVAPIVRGGKRLEGIVSLLEGYTVTPEDVQGGHYTIRAVEESTGRETLASIQYDSALAIATRQILKAGLTPLYSLQTSINTETNESFTGLILKGVREYHADAMTRLGESSDTHLGVLIFVNQLEPGNGKTRMDTYSMRPYDRLDLAVIRQGTYTGDFADNRSGHGKN